MGEGGGGWSIVLVLVLEDVVLTSVKVDDIEWELGLVEVAGGNQDDMGVDKMVQPESV